VCEIFGQHQLIDGRGLWQPCGQANFWWTISLSLAFGQQQTAFCEPMPTLGGRWMAFIEGLVTRDQNTI
jgi:hypothetical protein